MKNKIRTNLKTIFIFVILKYLFKVYSAFLYIFIKGFALLKVPYNIFFK